MYPPNDLQHRKGVSIHRGSCADSRSGLTLTSCSRSQITSISFAKAFTLVELLVVIAIMCLLMALAIPAFTAMNGSGDLSKAASDIESFLQEARSQAMANNTFVYVGLEEVDGINPTSSNGVGEIVMAAVATSDGTRSGYGVISSNIFPISKAVIFQNVHLTNALSLTSGNMINRPGQSGYATPNLPIVDISTNTSAVSFQYPLFPAPSKYIFQKVIEFDPQGVPRVQSGSSIQNYFEIPLIPAHGNTAATNSANQAAIQIDGVTGAVRIYRP